MHEAAQKKIEQISNTKYVCKKDSRKICKHTSGGGGLIPVQHITTNILADNTVEMRRKK